MTFARELDELRREARKSTATTFTYWPKVNGENIQASSTAGDCTFEVFDPAGNSIQAQANVTPTSAGTPTHSSLALAVDAIGSLGEDYRIKVRFKVTAESVVHEDHVFFDVVLFPFGSPSVSLNDLLEERPDIGEVLDRMGQLLGYTAGATAQNKMAAIFATRARVELEAMIRDQVAEDGRAYAVPSYASTDSRRSMLSDRYTRPNLILNRERLNRVERKLAMKLAYAAECAHPEGDDESAGLLRYYTTEALNAWRAVGPLKYDESEDLIPDTQLEDIGRVVRVRREQG